MESEAGEARLPFCFYGRGDAGVIAIDRQLKVNGTRKTWNVKANATAAQIAYVRETYQPDLLWMDHADDGPGYDPWTDVDAYIGWWIKRLSETGPIAVYDLAPPTPGSGGVFDASWKARNEKTCAALLSRTAAIMPRLYQDYTGIDHAAHVRRIVSECKRCRDKFAPGMPIIPFLSPRVVGGTWVPMEDWAVIVRECREADGVVVWDASEDDLTDDAMPFIEVAVSELK